MKKLFIAFAFLLAIGGAMAAKSMTDNVLSYKISGNATCYTTSKDIPACVSTGSYDCTFTVQTFPTTITAQKAFSDANCQNELLRVNP